MSGSGTRANSVVVTGIGVVTPIGCGRAEFWAALVRGESGIAPIAECVAAALPTVAARVRDFAAKEYIRSGHLRRMDKFSRMIVAAARMALEDAAIRLEDVPADRVGVAVGSALGNISESVIHLERVFTRGPSAASPMMFPNLVLNAPASYAAMETGATGVNLTVAQGETSGEQAIIAGCDAIRTGRADVVLAGGGDELGQIVFDTYRLARALSGQRGGAEWSSPYDAGRNGIVLGEGAAILVLESSERARARGATVHAEVEGDVSFGVPSSTYDWPVHAHAALTPLGRLLGSRPVELICGSANSTRRLDACELDLFTRLFGEGTTAVHLTSIKGAVGEFAAAGALTTAAACLALREQMVPPLCHLREPDADNAFRLARGRPQARPLERALVCGIARGGAGAALLLRRAER